MGDDDYTRQCTPEEWAILDSRFPDAFVEEQDEERLADELARTAYFAALAGPPIDEILPGEAGEGDRSAKLSGGGASTIIADGPSVSPTGCHLPTAPP